MTPFQKKALETLRDHPGITAGKFAEKMWPDNLMHVRISNGGHGAQSGKAGWLCGGSYLGKLRKKGWCRSGPRGRGYQLSHEGIRQLEDHE